jgi:GNAT superfamily N-acetyltransferase
MPSDITITVAAVEDAAEILALQRIAYQSEAKLYQDFDLPPLHETLAEVQAAFSKGVVLKAVRAGKIVGSVRGCLNKGTCLIMRLFVQPELRNRGLGARLMQAIEAGFPQAARFELFTGHKSVSNLHLYTKLGYVQYKSEPVHERLALVYLMKQITGE